MIIKAVLFFIHFSIKPHVINTHYNRLPSGTYLWARNRIVSPRKGNSQAEQSGGDSNEKPRECDSKECPKHMYYGEV